MRAACLLQGERADTPFDLPIEYAASGRAIYQPHVMQCCLPHEIELFYSDPAIPVSFGPNDVVEWHDWHCKHAGIRGRDPEDEFVHWRRWCMNWHTEGEQRKDAKQRVVSQRTFERFIAVLDELKKHYSEKKQMRSAKKNKKKQKNHAKHRRPIAPRIRILKRQRTASSSHSWMPSDVDNRPPAEEAGDVADAQCEGTSSPHSWMPSDVPEADGATPSSPHSWMPSPA